MAFKFSEDAYIEFEAIFEQALEKDEVVAADLVVVDLQSYGLKAL